MLKIVDGEKISGGEYIFRETCFGICVKDGKVLLVEKGGDLMLIGGGLEKGESHEVCLKREFLEESGYTVTKMTPLVSIDCYWTSREKTLRHSFAHNYIVEVAEKHINPTEIGHKVKKVDINQAASQLPLPYQRHAIEYYVENCVNKAK